MIKVSEPVIYEVSMISVHSKLVYIHVHKSWDKGLKKTFEDLSAKTNIYSKVCMCFYQCCFYLDWL